MNKNIETQKIKVNNGQELLFEYNDRKKKTIAAENSELENIKNCVEKQVNQSITRQQALNDSHPEKPNYPLWIGIGTVGVLVSALIAYFLIRKKKKVN